MARLCQCLLECCQSLSYLLSGARPSYSSERYSSWLHSIKRRLTFPIGNLRECIGQYPPPHPPCWYILYVLLLTLTMELYPQVSSHYCTTWPVESACASLVVNRPGSGQFLQQTLSDKLTNLCPLKSMPVVKREKESISLVPNNVRLLSLPSPPPRSRLSGVHQKEVSSLLMYL